MVRYTETVPHDQGYTLTRNDQIDVHLTLSMYQVHLLLKALRTLDVQHASDIRDVRFLAALLKRRFRESSRLHSADCESP